MALKDLFENNYMIGSNSVIRAVEKQLKNICEKNKEEYEFILRTTDVPEPKIELGHGKYNHSPRENRLLKINIISGELYGPQGKVESLEVYDFFKLSNTFEEDLFKKLNELDDALINVQKEECRTLNRLEKLYNQL